MAVFFQQDFPTDFLSVLFFQALLHGWNGDNFRFNDSAGRGGFREGFGQIRRKARQAGVCALHIVLGQTDIR